VAVRLAAALLLAVVAAAGLVAGVWLIFPPAALIVGGVLVGCVAYGLLTDEERAHL
jgi:hypothetical protein